jgi:MFS family permease
MSAADDRAGAEATGMLRRLLMMAPAGLVRRMAAGSPTAQDVRDLDILAGASETDAAQALQAGQYQAIAAGVRRAAAAGTPAPAQILAREVLTARRQGRSHRRPASQPHRLATAVAAWGASFVAGIVLAVAGGSMVHAADAGGWPAGPAHGWGMLLLVTGILLILAAVAAVAGLIIKDIARFTSEQHRRYQAWKQALPPEQRAYVEAAEFAGAAAAAAATIHHQWEKAKRWRAEAETGRAAGMAQVRQMYAGQWAQQQQAAALHDVAQQVATALQSGGDSGLLHRPNRSDIFGNLIPK